MKVVEVKAKPILEAVESWCEYEDWTGSVGKPDGTQTMTEQEVLEDYFLSNGLLLDIPDAVVKLFRDKPVSTADGGTSHYPHQELTALAERNEKLEEIMKRLVQICNDMEYIDDVPLMVLKNEAEEMLK